MREVSSTGSEPSAEMTSVSEKCDEDPKNYDISHIDGFAEIFPEDKHMIVTLLQSKGFIVGMTGDGANVLFLSFIFISFHTPFLKVTRWMHICFGLILDS